MADLAFALDAPPLIVAGTHDSLTPLALAEELNEALEGSFLLRSEHYGHGAFDFAGECVGRAIGEHLGGLLLPPPNTTCPAP
jgi:pimeloyl-ACP methyl ester carboxylesterase